MSHDLRNEIGYREIPAADPEEQRMREQLFAVRGRLVQEPGNPTLQAAETDATRALAGYLWRRACAQVEEDRKKHPKARRNQVPTFPLDSPQGDT